MPALLIRVRFLDGRYHGAGDWPPAPARLFQALVAAAARGRTLDPDDRAALLWLERQAPPVIAAPAAEPQPAVTVYVPNNDTDATGIDTPNRIPKLVRPWLFDPAAPLFYLWPEIEAGPQADRAVAIAGHLYRFGRGVDPAFAEAMVLGPEAADAMLAAQSGAIRHPGASGAGGMACPMPGSLESLEARHAGLLRRFATLRDGRRSVTTFTQPPKPRFAQVLYDAPPQFLLYDIREPGQEGFAAVPAARAAPIVAGLIRQAAARLARSGAVPAVPMARFLTGREAGPQDVARRVRVIALPTLRRHVDRAIRRVAVEIPADCPLRADDLDWAFLGLDLVDPESGQVMPGRLVPAEDRSMLARYLGPARLWHSETPIALPGMRRRIDPGNRAAEAKGGTEAATEIAAAAAALRQALRHARIDVPATAIRLRREPFAAQGTRAEAFAAGTRFSRHALWHAEIAFAAPVAGPLLVGDGRFAGLGLMAPADAPRAIGRPGAHRRPGARTGAGPVPDAFAFDILDGLADADADPAALARALRRALMARARLVTGSDRLAGFFTGHAPDGAPLRGAHGHVAVAADLPRGRLLVLAPHHIGHRAATEAETPLLPVLAAAALGLRDLRAGAAGRLRLAPAPLGDADPLRAPATRWESVSPYAPTRHAKRLAPETAVAADIAAEAARHALPRPTVTVLALEVGPRGGLSARIALGFAVPVAGPVLLGRTLHQGGGLFAPTAPAAPADATR